MTAPGAPIMGQRKNKLLVAARETLKLTKQMHVEYCKALCGENGKIPKAQRVHIPRCAKTATKIAHVDALYRGI